MTMRRLLLLALIPAASAACATRTTPPPADEHGSHAMTPPAAVATTPVAMPASAMATSDSTLPADAAGAAARLAASPRHAEWVMIATQPGGSTDSVRAYVVYPERKSRAPVVVVVHEIFGLTSWVRGVADQLARDGFIAVAPDLLTGEIAANTPDSILNVEGRAAIQRLVPARTLQRVTAAANYGMGLPAALPKYGIIGFCWGGSASFIQAGADARLGAAVPYYGGAVPERMNLAAAKAPTLAFYGGNDARVNATIPAADSAYRRAGTSFEAVVLEGAGHGFLRQQTGQNGANMAATRAAWPRTLAFFRQHLGA